MKDLSQLHQGPDGRSLDAPLQQADIRPVELVSRGGDSTCEIIDNCRGAPHNEQQNLPQRWAANMSMDVGPLWTRVNDAKLALDLAFNYLHEVQRDLRSGAVSESDGRYAYQRALRAQEVAAQNYMDALSAFKDAVRTQKPRATVAGEPEG